MSLVKSLSTEIESREVSSLKPRPLLSLVKSISTEISRSEPEVTQSKSDSKLNLHLWRQLTQPKGRNGDSKTAPPSPSGISPSEGKGGFFKVPEVEAKLEDTKRKFSEAMQEPLSMLSKIMGDENSGSPKQRSGLADSLGSNSSWSGGQANGDGVAGQGSRKGDCDRLAVCDTPIRQPRRSPQKAGLSPELRCKMSSRGSRYEICTYGDVIQVVEIEAGADPQRAEAGERPSAFPTDLPPLPPSQAVPGKCLFCVAALAYSYFILPLPSYLSGLSLGLACGFMLGLLLILLLAPRAPPNSSSNAQSAGDSLQTEILAGECRNPEVLKGWMNEMHLYDPETYHPSLTHSVFVSLEGSSLRLAYPRTNIPRRATFHEPPHDAVFVSSSSFQLAHSKVFLMPPALARKRVWNKKYPICIVLRSSQEGTDGEKANRPYYPSFIYYLFMTEQCLANIWFYYFHMNPQIILIPCEPPSVMKASSPSGQVPCSVCSRSESLQSLTQTRTGQVLRVQGASPHSATTVCVFVLELVISFYYVSWSRRLDLIGDVSFGTSLCPSEISATYPCFRGHCESVCSLAWKSFFEKCIPSQKQCLLVSMSSNPFSRAMIHLLSFLKSSLPYFMNELTLTELDMGTSMPQVISMSKPWVNYRGLWLELEVMYTGSLQMTLETKMNLCKLGKESSGEAESILEPGREGKSRPRVCVLADSDEESSSAGSSDEEEVPPSEPQGMLGDKTPPPGAESHLAGGSTGRKILRFVDKIAKSKYFQKATENEYIKKKIEEVSNTPLLLTVEVQELSGTLAINIPPPPTDRIWYSFRVPPRLDLRVRPKLGEREVTFTHVTEWIERKLQHEFQKVFVMPNMDDLYLPLMHSGLDNPPTSQQSTAQASRQLSEEYQESPDEETPFTSE
ncbi:TEX2 protein, partial [Amia calva]|nr:TEX2 protein [Amia calva]